MRIKSNHRRGGVILSALPVEEIKAEIIPEVEEQEIIEEIDEEEDLSEDGGVG